MTNETSAVKNDLLHSLWSERVSFILCDQRALDVPNHNHNLSAWIILPTQNDHWIIVRLQKFCPPADQISFLAFFLTVSKTNTHTHTHTHTLKPYRKRLSPLPNFSWEQIFMVCQKAPFRKWKENAFLMIKLISP